MGANQIVEALKERNEDFEWYPTTQEIVDRLAGHIFNKRKYGHGEYECEYSSVLDIGCGNGSFFSKIDQTQMQKSNAADAYAPRLLRTRYGIEKSLELCERLPDDVVIIGSDFNEQTLIDKKVDLIFCNPPYSEFETWTERIIMQGNCKAIALVIPCRWRMHPRISYALKKRGMKAESLGTFDFLNAERRARAKVDLLFITADDVDFDGRRYRKEANDPFDVWFDETFKISAEKEKVHEWERNEAKRQELVTHGDTAEMLVQFYNSDMEKLYSNYRQLETLDADIFKELKVDVKNLKAGLKERISGLKHLYWDELFKKYDKITQRLTSKGRRKVIERLQDNTAIDFTLNNIFQLTLWLIRNSNTMFDEQITDFFYSLCNAETIHRYKSNLRWGEDDWRYIKNGFDGTHFRSDVDEHRKKLKNVMLDYRIIVQAYSNFDYSSWSSRVGMSGDCIDFLEDTYIIAENLGFNVTRELPQDRHELSVEYWRNFDVHLTDGSLFANIKLYKNGNRHVKFCKEFMQKLNVEMARINGWVQDKSEAATEMGMSTAEIERFWGSNRKIEITAGKQLLGLPA
ncbi:MAG: DUF4942 domain-containing protein [Treponemataceae bacterium]|nr:DUF4942 domain-containing protein [Treponemataceae bacterium]